MSMPTVPQELWCVAAFSADATCNMMQKNDKYVATTNNTSEP